MTYITWVILWNKKKEEEEEEKKRYVYGASFCLDKCNEQWKEMVHDISTSKTRKEIPGHNGSALDTIGAECWRNYRAHRPIEIFPTNKRTQIISWPVNSTTSLIEPRIDFINVIYMYSIIYYVYTFHQSTQNGFKQWSKVLSFCVIIVPDKQKLFCCYATAHFHCLWLIDTYTNSVKN